MLKKYDYDDKITDDYFRVGEAKKKAVKSNDDGWVTVKKVNKKEELEKKRAEERRRL